MTTSHTILMNCHLALIEFCCFHLDLILDEDLPLSIKLFNHFCNPNTYRQIYSEMNRTTRVFITEDLLISKGGSKSDNIVGEEA